MMVSQHFSVTAMRVGLKDRFKDCVEVSHPLIQKCEMQSRTPQRAIRCPSRRISTYYYNSVIKHMRISVVLGEGEVGYSLYIC